MNVLLTALCLHAVTAVSPLSFRLSTLLQERFGYSRYTDSALNGLPDFIYYDNLLRPAGQLDFKLRQVTLQAIYQPQFLFRMQFPQPPNTGPTHPIIYHRFTLRGTAGSIDNFYASGTAFLSLGSIDLANADNETDATSEFGSTIVPPSASAIATFYTLRGNGRVEKTLGHDWRFIITELLSDIHSQSNSLISSLNPGFDTGRPNAPVSLKTQLRSETLNTFERKYPDDSRLLLNLGLTALNFPAQSAYIGVSPSVGVNRPLGPLTTMTLRGGAMKYWGNPYPGRYLTPRYIPIADLMLNKRFTDFGLPRLTGQVHFTMAPFYDLLFGLLWPRTQLMLLGMYEFTRDLRLSANVRAYTYEYFDGNHWVPLQKGRYKYVTQAELRLRYVQSKALTFESGVRMTDRFLVPSNTQPQSHRQGFFVFAGVTAALVVD